MISKAIRIALLGAFASVGMTQWAWAQGSLWDRIVGPRNFDECVLRNTRNSPPHANANLIIMSCRNLFPEPEYNNSPAVNMISFFPDVNRRTIPVDLSNNTWRFQFNNASENIIIYSMRATFEINRSAESRIIVDCFPESSPVRPYENKWLSCPYRYNERSGNLSFTITHIMGSRVR